MLEANIEFPPLLVQLPTSIGTDVQRFFCRAGLFGSVCGLSMQIFFGQLVSVRNDHLQWGKIAQSPLEDHRHKPARIPQAKKIGCLMHNVLLSVYEI